MSISSAMQTGVSGLNANSVAVGEISENIANANTTGYKRSFAQMVTMTPTGGLNAPSGVNAVVSSDLQNGGAVIPTNSPTDFAVNGNGFFVVSSNANTSVQSDYVMTRAGSFQPDENGNLVNSAGYFLSGYPYTDVKLATIDGNSFNGLKTVNITDATLSAKATTSIGVQGNLPSQETGNATPGAPFTSSSQYYTPLGAVKRLEYSWQPTSTPNQWDITVSDGDGVPYGQVTVDFAPGGANAGAPISYSGVTNLATAPGAFSMDTTTGVMSLTMNDGGTTQPIEIGLGALNSFDGITQFAGDFTPQKFTADGSSSGALTRIEVDDTGTMYGIFDNGQRQPLYKIPLAHVENPNGMQEIDGDAYRLTRDSGAYTIHKANEGPVGTISSGALEGSNVDIAQELSDLIRTQRAYSTNAKIVTTMDEMLDETTRLKR
ncbi:flagellar hook protein [Thioclava sp. JM3]|uniref:flagellar hook protein FlgE n=1 Tax=unclassified Thioclava TaxID=2621713 RepID=UPI000B538D16|nr:MULTISPECIES: flagellar hook protein FlgE [unclassified Thioclava]OWY01219.1 flagellar hook protein [Thioclava sp. F1Mire-8]OWY15730.1 flagellar hook protein [Thioclava sp. JM3]